MEKNGVPSSRRGPSRGQAFTLVELLVVVAIIGVLAGLLFPTFKGIRQLARSSGCASNLHTLQVGLTQFLAANRFRAPGAGGDTGDDQWVANTRPDIWWGEHGRENIRDGQIWDFVQNYETYLCPDFEAVCRQPPPGAESRAGVPYGQGYSTVPSFDPSSFDPVRSYGQSEQVGDQNAHFAQLDASKTVWLCDENPWRQLYQYQYPGAPEPEFGIDNARVGVDDAPGEYHGGKANCTFGDGHVEKLTPLEILEDVQGTN